MNIFQLSADAKDCRTIHNIRRVFVRDLACRIVVIRMHNGSEIWRRYTSYDTF